MPPSFRQTGYNSIYSAIRVEILITPAVNLRGLIIALDLLDNYSVSPRGRDIKLFGCLLDGFLQLLEERQDVAALQLTADDHLASSINGMHLKD